MPEPTKPTETPCASPCDYKREPYSGAIQVYTCRTCGDQYEQDVS
jgi:hypothetical protein